MDVAQMEQIGRITLDYSKYPGEDLYCDGAVEDELLELVKGLPPGEYQDAIEERKSWPVLYHLSSQRENIVEWIPMEKTDKVLEVGSGCGAVTGALARRAGEVTCVDLSRKRSLINAHRHSECDNVTIHVGNFKDIEPNLAQDYDYICLIGVFEYGQGYIGGDTPYEDFLRILMRHLKEGGRIIIAIENKYGLKYFAGCQEDHLGRYFSGIENYSCGGGVRTFSRRGLEGILHRCGVKEYHFYYPYPDYKLMTTLYSDAYLPGKGELSNNLRNFDRDRMLLFDEKSAFDGLAEDGLFSVFSNSYLVVIGGDFPDKYVKYSNDRAPEYQIRTVIGRDEKGNPFVRKYPLTPEAEEHVRSMAVAYENLTEKYAGGRLEINRCRLAELPDTGEVYAEFEFVEGTPLTELMDQCLERKDVEGFYQYFREYVERIGYHSEYPVADFDLIFSNILVQGDTWTLIDYEWTFGKPIDTKELAFRAICCYLMENEKRSRLDRDRIMRELDITEENARSYQEEERDFQKFVTGKRKSMSELYGTMGHSLYRPVEWLGKVKESRQVRRVQIYEDRGEGFSEEQSYFLWDAYQDEQTVEMELKVSGEVKILRIDPAMDSCVVRVAELTLNGGQVPLSNRRIFYTNGKALKPEPGAVFVTEDPNLYLKLENLHPQAENLLRVRLEVVRLPETVAAALAESVKRIL